MPNIRCRFYDPDTGAPIRAGCRKGGDCDFVHPSSSKWFTASLPRIRFQPDYEGIRGRDRRPSGIDPVDSGSTTLKGPREGGWPSSSAAAGANKAAPSRRSPVPTEPRAMQTKSGSAPIGGTAWSTSQPDSTTHTASAAASSSTNTSPAAKDMSWGAPSGGGWGAPTSGGWGESSTVEGGWGDTAATTSTSASASSSAVPSAPASSSALPPPSARPQAPAAPSQQSPTRENAESVIWGDRKGKGRDIGTPQYGFTPRTPRSPNRSPERDPRRQQPGSSNVSTATTSPRDYLAVESTVSKEMRQLREGVRMISSGIYVPTALAGDGTVASSSKTNPFAFPTYSPPEKIDVDRGVGEEGAVTAADVDFERSQDTDADEDIPVLLTEQWKDYIRTVSRAIRSNMDIRAISETRSKLKRLHNSKMYASASQVAAHARLQDLDGDASKALQRARSRYETAIKRLMRYPLDGLPAPSDNDPRLNDAENVRRHVEDISKWMQQMQTSVDELEVTIRLADGARRRVEEENRQIRAEQERVAAVADAQTQQQQTEKKWVPINSTRKAMAQIEEMFDALEERVTDLEYGFMDIRETTPPIGDAVLQRLVELGFYKPTEEEADQLERREATEEGEMPFQPPVRPMSNEELTDECRKLEKLLEEYSMVVEHDQQQLTELRGRRVTRDRNYHELAVDNASLNIKVKQLEETQQDQAKLLAQTEKDIANLTELLERYKNDRPPPPPPSPTSDEIIAELLKTVLPELRSAVKLAAGKLKHGVDDALVKQQEVLCQQLFITLQPAMAIVKTAKGFIDCQGEVLMPLPPPSVQTQSVQ